MKLNDIFGDDIYGDDIFGNDIYDIRKYEERDGFCFLEKRPYEYKTFLCINLTTNIIATENWEDTKAENLKYWICEFIKKRKSKDQEQLFLLQDNDGYNVAIKYEHRTKRLREIDFIKV